MNISRKKELVDAYKQREIIGGIYAIVCEKTGKRMIDCTADLAGAKNRFAFSASTQTCIFHSLQADWNQHGASAFSFQVLETLPKQEDETLADYKKGLALLRDCIREETPVDRLYQ